MNEIACRQNEEKPLKIQFAARRLFNRAETSNYVVWGLYAISTAVGLINDHLVAAHIAAAIIIVADFLAWIISRQIEKDICLAAALRNFFDRYVMGINVDCAEVTVDSLYEVAETWAQRYHNDYITQVTHTGEDSPPGVKDWYCTSVDASGDMPAGYYLMKENAWWDKKMVKSKLLLYGVITVCVFTVAIITLHKSSLASIVVFIGGTLGLIIRFFERILVMIQYERKSGEIDILLRNFENLSYDKRLLVVQEAIESRRDLPVVHCNALHTRLAKKLHGEYRAINSGRID